MLLFKLHLLFILLGNSLDSQLGLSVAQLNLDLGGALPSINDGVYAGLELDLLPVELDLDLGLDLK